MTYISVFASRCQKIVILVVKAFIVSAVEGVSDLLHEVVVEIEVMNDCQAHTERFLCLYEVTYV